MLKRFHDNKIETLIEPNKVLIVYGPRQIGKTTLIKNYLKNYHGLVYDKTGEDINLRNVLESFDFTKIIKYFSNYDLIFIDEAQKISNIGQSLKIIVDQIPNIKIIATGSSSFDLSNKIGEPLVGRHKIIKLSPLSVLELKNQYGNAYVYDNLEMLMIFGGYPEVINKKNVLDKIEYISLITSSYLYKDILELEQIRHSKKLNDLLQLLAWQIGQEVSLHEIGQKLGLSKNTVHKYLDLLEKSFVLINVRGYSRNLRKEITKTSRFYFYDLGVRNAIIGNFNWLNQRNDVGQLWENFMFIERLKKQQYHRMYTKNYFWRTWDQQEIDHVEESGDGLHGYEFKWNPKKIVAPPKIWLKAYPKATFSVINKDNFFDFVS